VAAALFKGSQAEGKAAQAILSAAEPVKQPPPTPASSWRRR
jgi:hypothetical protein